MKIVGQVTFELNLTTYHLFFLNFYFISKSKEGQQEINKMVIEEPILFDSIHFN